jgi:hypothetical protein
VAAALDSLGFDSTVVERAFDENFHPNVARREPTLALAGFDGRDPRLLLDNDRFAWAVDGGLGRGWTEYLDIVVNTIPSREGAATAFPPERPRGTPLADAYETEIVRRIAGGEDEAAVRCGMLSIAGVNIGAAFVGAFAGTIVIADILRLLHGGRPFSVVHVDLRNPTGLATAPNAAPGTPTPAFALSK